MDNKWNEQLINELRQSTSDLLVGHQRENFGDFQHRAIAIYGQTSLYLQQ